MYTQVYRLTRLAYLIFSAALNLTTNAAWTPINRGWGGGGGAAGCPFAHTENLTDSLGPIPVVSSTYTVKIA